jgi:hypothetical protein
VCQEIGLASWLDSQEPGKRKPGEGGNGDSGDGAQWVRVEPPTGVSGAAVLCRASPSNTCWGQASRLRGESVDWLGRTLDGLYAHDLTKLFASIASRARQIFGITAKQVQVDTTSFSVSGEDARAEGDDATVIAITSGYWRDHREERTAVDGGEGFDARWSYSSVHAASGRHEPR